MRPTLVSSLWCLVLLFHPASSLASSPTGDGLASAVDRTLDRGVPTAGQGPIEYLIVTSRSLRPEFMALARERSRNGIPSAVRSLESFASEYPTAVDEADRLRRFLRDAHDHWATRWVLLGGDVEVIPPRFVTERDVLPERSFVSDWYYACLDGTWDSDGDGRFGELPFGGDPGDSPDLEPELFVGRAPVRGRAEARAFVEKTLAYERRPPDGFANTTLMFAHRLVLDPFTILDFAATAEEVLPRITDDPAQRVTRLYESWDDPSWVPGAEPETRASVIEALDQGHNVTLGLGLGSPDLLAVGAQSSPDPQLLTVADVLGLTNGDRAGHVWLATSFVGAFDHPTSLAEAFVRAPRGGAVTAIASSDLTLVGQDAALMEQFVRTVFDEGASTIGEALVRARSIFVFPAGGPAMVLSYQLLGDPLLRPFSSSPVAAAEPGHPLAPVSTLAPRGEGSPRSERWVLATGAITSAAREPAGDRARAPRLALSRPNPSPATSWVRIEWQATGELAVGEVVAIVLDLAGRTVRRLDPGSTTAGAHVLSWDLRDQRGAHVPAGIYFMRVRVGGASGTRRVVVTRP
jgi:peptidase C25-like protein/flagellar hook capping protein FlgD